MIKKITLIMIVFCVLFSSCKNSTITITPDSDTKDETLKKNKECEIKLNLPFSLERSAITANYFDVDDVTFYRATVSGKNTDNIAYSVTKDFYSNDERKLILKEEGTFTLNLIPYYTYGTFEKEIGSGTSDEFSIEYGDSKTIDISITPIERPAYSTFKISFTPTFSRLYEDSYIKKDVSYYKLDYIYQIKNLYDDYNKRSYYFTDYLTTLMNNNYPIYYGSNYKTFEGNFNDKGGLSFLFDLIKRCSDEDTQQNYIYYKDGSTYNGITFYQHCSSIINNQKHDYNQNIIYHTGDVITIPYLEDFEDVQIFWILTPYDSNGTKLADSIGTYFICQENVSPADITAGRRFNFIAGQEIELNVSPSFQLYQNPNYDESSTDIDIGVNVTWSNP